MLPRWQGGVATAAVSAVGIVLVALDLSDAAVRHFWSTHALTTDTVSGLLVVALTVLVVDQVLRRRQLTERSRAVAAHAAIMLTQARRSVQAVLSVRDGAGDRAAAGEEMRSYLFMLLVGAPVLIEAPVARRFLERAQTLAAEMGRVLAPSDVAAVTAGIRAAGLNEAIDGLKAAAAPLLAVLSVDERSAVADGGA